jgi:double-stranded uracil-DNA glycosylase
MGPEVRVLVLGSLPGARSLEAGLYYAHAQNRFWPLVERVFGIPASAPAPERYRALVASGVGLWDGLEAAARPGSLDADIEAASEAPNAVGPLLREHPRVRSVALNGRKAEAIWKKWLEPTLSADMRARVRVHSLPSTSPANARFRLDDLVEAWGPVLTGP